MAVYLERDQARLRAYLSRSRDEPREWSDAAGLTTSTIFVTADELKAFFEQVHAADRAAETAEPPGRAARGGAYGPCPFRRLPRRLIRAGLRQPDVKDYFRSMSFTSGQSRWGDVYVTAGSRALSMAGDALAATTLALALQDRGAGGLAVSGLWLAATLPLVALAPLTGRLIDRFDSRVLLVSTGLAQAAVCAVLAFVTAPIALIALVAVLAAGLAISNPTFSALVPSMVSREDLPKASAIGQTASMIGTLLGPAAAGFLVGAFGTRPPLLIDALTYLAVAVAGLLLRTRRNARGAAAPTADGAAPPAPWRLRGDGLLLATFLTFGAVVAGVGGVNVIEVFFIRDTLGASASAFGLVTACWTAGMAAGAWVFAKVVRRYDDDSGLARGTLLLLGATCVPVVHQRRGAGCLAGRGALAGRWPAQRRPRRVQHRAGRPPGAGTGPWPGVLRAQRRRQRWRHVRLRAGRRPARAVLAARPGARVRRGRVCWRCSRRPPRSPVRSGRNASHPRRSPERRPTARDTVGAP